MNYDSSTQMYVSEPREPDLAQLRWLRWLVEHGHLEHETPAGPSSGEYAGEG